MTNLKHIALISLLAAQALQATTVTPQVTYQLGSSLFFTDVNNAVFTTGEAHIFYGTFNTLPSENSTAQEIENLFNQLGVSTDVNSASHTFSSSVEETLFENQRGYLVIADHADIGQASHMAIVSHASDSDWTFAADLSFPAFPTPSITPDNLIVAETDSELILGSRDTYAGGFETIKLQLVGVSEPSYATWVSFHELSGEDALETATPAGDGINNLIKYALRLDPNEFVSMETDGVVPGKPTIIESGEGLKFTFLRNAEASDLTYTIQSCDDLSSWEPVTSGVSETVLSASLVKVEALLPAGTARFCRLLVTK